MATCNECSYQFTSVRSLLLHMATEHSPSESYLFKCGEANCFRHFDRQSSYQKHLNKTHGIALESNDINCLRINDHLSNSNNILHSDNEGSDDSTEVGLNISGDDFGVALRTDAAKIVSTIYSKRRFPLNAAQTVLGSIQKFLGGGHLSTLKAKVENALSRGQCFPEDIKEIMVMFEKLENPFEGIDTEYKRLKWLEDEGYYIKPQQYVIDRSFAPVRRKKELRGEMIDLCGQFIPLRWTLKKFFELPNALSSTLNYMASLSSESSIIRNLIQGPHWLQKRARYQAHDIVIPLCASCDDVNVNNALGAHDGKVAAMYVTIPCLPPEVSSQLDNYFLALVYESWIRKDKLRQTYQPVIDEFTYLETEGINISTVDGPKRVYFVLALLSGDNLGLHGMLGLVESFSANHYCRFCKMEKIDCQKVTDIPPELLRTIENYEADCLLKNCVSEAGIREPCPFNDIPSFHGMKNPTADEMHDFREGIAEFDMVDILYNLTNGPDAAFPLEVLNERLRTFDYGPIDGRNKPNLIREIDLSTHKKLKMTASEMTRLVLRLGVIMGDMVDEENPHWKFYLILREMFDFTLAKKITHEDISAFESLIVRHHQVVLTPICHRNEYKPKDHFGLHLADVARQIGPVSNVSSMRPEGKNVHLTTPAKSSLSRINIAHTLAKREQLAFADRLLKNKSILPPTRTGGKLTVLETEKLNYCLPSLLQKYRTLNSPSFVEYKGTVFLPKMALITGTKNLWPTFAEIEQIVVQDELKVPFFVCRCLDNLGFDEHKWAYEVTKTIDKICISVNDLLDPLPVTIHTSPKGELYIGLRYAI